jgi:hypothetical protein
LHFDATPLAFAAADSPLLLGCFIVMHLDPRVAASLFVGVAASLFVSLQVLHGSSVCNTFFSRRQWAGDGDRSFSRILRSPCPAFRVPFDSQKQADEENEQHAKSALEFERECLVVHVADCLLMAQISIRYRLRTRLNSLDTVLITCDRIETPMGSVLRVANMYGSTMGQCVCARS